MGNPHFLMPYIGDLDLPLHALLPCIMFLPLAFWGANCGESGVARLETL
ncbi:MAG: hypothetical protein JWM83_37 [Candidatus Angelobacter sp.]|nr:hypothetical protein [Candidatus Angelobacter sp.]